MASKVLKPEGRALTFRAKAAWSVARTDATKHFGGVGMVILIDAERRSDWLVKAIDRRLREEFAKLRVAINEDKSRMVDLKKGESFTFLGFEYRRILSFRQKWRPYYAPKLK